MKNMSPQPESQSEPRIDNVIHADFSKPSVLQRFCSRYGAENIMEAVNTSYKSADVFMRICGELSLNQETLEACIVSALDIGINAALILVENVSRFEVILSHGGLEEALMIAVANSKDARDCYLEDAYKFGHLDCHRRVLEVAMMKQDTYSEDKAFQNRRQFRLVLGGNFDDNEGSQLKSNPPSLTVVK